MKNELVLSPFSRVGGDLQIKLVLEDHRVVESYCSGTLFRGFENLLEGKSLMDALVFVCRICGVCGVSHSIAATRAMEEILEVKIPPNGYLCRNIALAAEVVLNQLTHFYLLFAPDLTNKRYSSHSLYPGITTKFSPFSGVSCQQFVMAREKLLAIMGILAGKWPNTLAFQPGGTTKTISRSEKMRCLGSLREFQSFVEQVLLGCEIQNWLENRNEKDMKGWLGIEKHSRSDLGTFIRFGEEAGLCKLGRSKDRFLCYGGYENYGQRSEYKAGFYEEGRSSFFDVEKITEDVTFSWFEETDVSPFKSSTRAFPKKENAYSWSKSPRYQGHPVEVGPLSRMIVNGNPFLSSIFKKSGSNVYSRTLARLCEAVILTHRIGEWIRQVNPDESFYNKPQRIKKTDGVGLIEAARGALGHWVRVEGAKIKDYQIVTPTTWNFSPRDSKGVPGILEQVLVDTEVENPEDPLEIYQIVRSFDPCLFCSVHLAEGKDVSK